MQKEALKGTRMYYSKKQAQRNVCYFSQFFLKTQRDLKKENKCTAKIKGITQ